VYAAAAAVVFVVIGREEDHGLHGTSHLEMQ